MNCFVIMPFSTVNSSSIYENWIKRAVEECQINDMEVTCHRADKSYKSGEIIYHVIEQLATADIVIADLTSQNPNVFYELGVRHTLKNNTILVTQDLKDIPFDLRMQRIIHYEYTPDGMLELKDNIKAFIKEIISAAEVIDNPVKKYLHEQDVLRIIKAETSLGQNTVQLLMNEFTSLRLSFTEQVAQLTRVIEGFTVTSALKVEYKEPSSESKNINHLAEFAERYTGAWISDEMLSHYYIEMIKGKLRICYCYGGNYELTSHCFDFKFSNNVLVANFHWFNSDISGLIFFELDEINFLSGGWWSKEDIREEVTILQNLRDLRTRHMYKITLERRHSITYDNYPKWATDYFEGIE